MKNETTEVNFDEFKTNFDTLYEKVQKNGETVTLTLKSRRKVFIVSEKDYDQISRFVIPTLAPTKSLTSS